jgi:hypothetical protein
MSVRPDRQRNGQAAAGISPRPRRPDCLSRRVRRSGYQQLLPP